MVSRRVRRRRRQVAVIGVLALILILILVFSGGSGPPPPPAPSPQAQKEAAALKADERTPLNPTWRGSGKPVTFAFGGDVHFQGVLGTRLADDPATALDGTVSSLLSGSNLSVANFESALTNGTCPDPQNKQFIFYSPATALTAFKDGGIDVMTMANDHGEDCGPAGLQMSLAAAASAHYPDIGIGADAAQAFAPYRTVIDGQRVDVFAATQIIDTGLAPTWTATATQSGVASAIDPQELIAAVQAARRTTDTIVVYLHWGTEPQNCPNPQQEPLAQELVQAGADIVVGSEAHVQEGAGYLGSAFIDYGLGNLAFYDDTAPETDSGTLIVSATGRRINSYSWRPATIVSGLPQPLTGSAATAAVASWATLRGCTDLAAAPSPSTASVASETHPPSLTITTTPTSGTATTTTAPPAGGTTTTRGGTKGTKKDGATTTSDRSAQTTTTATDNAG